jgi:hypothetical protein
MLYVHKRKTLTTRMFESPAFGCLNASLKTDKSGLTTGNRSCLRRRPCELATWRTNRNPSSLEQRHSKLVLELGSTLALELGSKLVLVLGSTLELELGSKLVLELGSTLERVLGSTMGRDSSSLLWPSCGNRTNRLRLEVRKAS